MRGHLDQWRCADKHLYGLSKAGIILALKLSLLTETVSNPGLLDHDVCRGIQNS